MEKRDFAFDRVNFILLAAGMIVVIVGFILMSGAGSSEEVFNPEIFSARRIKLAPAVCLFGFLFMIYGILHKPASKSEKTLQESESSSDMEK
ncbi:MAG: DUF3098 domain-containing protein [Paraprevotella sp.]|nr:DUF3098 domain-containing protein [Paraprevotella sp.]MBP3472704.1 DUF3098 domain-containing protein [Paraprevotella sp.]